MGSSGWGLGQETPTFTSGLRHVLKGLEAVQLLTDPHHTMPSAQASSNPALDLGLNGFQDPKLYMLLLFAVCPLWVSLTATEDEEVLKRGPREGRADPGWNLATSQDHILADLLSARRTY